jgi:hypothetical protein
MANLNLSEFGEKTFVADADWVFVWDTVGSISKKVSRNNWLSVGSIATSTPVTISQTWTDAAVAFAAFKIVATDTNSAAGSDFLELYSGTSTQPLRLDIQKSGQINIYGTWTNSSTYERLSLSAPTAANAIIGTNRSGGTARGLDFHTEGAARMTIGTNGYVGIGTTAPRTKLHLEDTTLAPVLEFSSANIPNYTGVGFNPQIGSNTNARLIAIGNTVGGIALSGFTTTSVAVPPLVLEGYHGASVSGIAALQFHSYKHNGSTGRTALAAGEISYNFSNATTSLMTMLGSGNVGIGTTAPSSKLQVTGGDVEIETVTSGIIMKAAGTSTRYRITLNAGGTALVFTAI